MRPIRQSIAFVIVDFAPSNGCANMIELVFRNGALGGRKHSTNVLAGAGAADQLWHEMHRQRAVFAPEATCCLG